VFSFYTWDRISGLSGKKSEFNELSERTAFDSKKQLLHWLGGFPQQRYSYYSGKKHSVTRNTHPAEPPVGWIESNCVNVQGSANDVQLVR
jgi:hypothetical protein